MLTQICQEIRNWFNRNQPQIRGKIQIVNGKPVQSEFLQKIKNDQYFRIIGSVFNDGVWKYDDKLALTDEEFEGAIWLMAIPQAFLDLAKDIEDWQKINGQADSEAMSPFMSESFGGYSYSKGTNASTGGTETSWQKTFASQLNIWRKI
jgi:hypothetical protein